MQGVAHYHMHLCLEHQHNKPSLSVHHIILEPEQAAERNQLCPPMHSMNHQIYFLLQLSKGGSTLYVRRFTMDHAQLLYLHHQVFLWPQLISHREHIPSLL